MVVRGIIAVLGLATGTAQAASLSLSGEVRALGAEPIYVPTSNISPVVLRYFIGEGRQVEPGDVIVRIDPGQSLSQIRSLDAQIEQAIVKADKEVASLEVKRLDAEIVLVEAQATLDKARIDAALPRSVVSALNFDRYQGELGRAQREYELRVKERAAARTAVARRRKDATLEIDKLKVERDFHRLRVEAAEQRATRAGIVVHGFDPSQGQRYEEGSSAQMGVQIGEVIGDETRGVRAWALEPDREGLAVGQYVNLYFDALPGKGARGRITRVSGAPDTKAEWSAARWFEIDIEFAEPTGQLELLPGMSVRVALGDTVQPDTRAQ